MLSKRVSLFECLFVVEVLCRLFVSCSMLCKYRVFWRNYFDMWIEGCRCGKIAKIEFDVFMHFIGLKSKFVLKTNVSLIRIGF